MRNLLYCVLCVFILALAGCRASGGRQALVQLVPADSFAVLSVEWQTVRKDDGLSQLIRGDEVEKVFRALGIDGGAISDFVMFSDGSGADGSNGIILDGKYDAQRVVNNLKASGWREQEYHKYLIYSDASGKNQLAPLKANLLAFGTASGVRRVIDAASGTQKSLVSQPLYRKIASRSGSVGAPIFMAVLLTQDVRDMASAAVQITSTITRLAGMSPLGDLLNEVGVAQGFGCDVSKSGSSLRMEVQVVMKDEGAASFASGSLNIMKRLALAAPSGNMPAPDVRMRESIRTMLIRSERDVLFVQLTMPENGLRGG